MGISVEVLTVIVSSVRDGGNLKLWLLQRGGRKVVGALVIVGGEVALVEGASRPLRESATARHVRQMVSVSVVRRLYRATGRDVSTWIMITRPAGFEAGGAWVATWVALSLITLCSSEHARTS